MNPLLQEVLTLLQVGATEAIALSKPGSDVNKGATLSADFIAAANAVLSRHASNVGQPIEEVLKTL